MWFWVYKLNSALLPDYLSDSTRASLKASLSSFMKSSKINSYPFTSYKTIEQLIDECYVDCATENELHERLEYVEHLQVEPLTLKDENSIVWLYTNDVDLYELNGVLYLLADELSEAVCVINI